MMLGRESLGVRSSNHVCNGPVVLCCHGGRCWRGVSRGSNDVGVGVGGGRGIYDVAMGVAAGQ